MPSAMHPQTLLAYEVNEKPFRQDTARHCGLLFPLNMVLKLETHWQYQL